MTFDMGKIRAQLEAKLADLQKDSADLAASLPEMTLPGQAEEEDSNMGESAVRATEVQRTQMLLINQRAFLAAVKEAIARIDQGTYGRCIICGNPIPERRLAAIPWAARDIECEEQWEQQEHLSEDEILVGRD